MNAFFKNNFSHKGININSIICFGVFFHTYQHFLVILLDCVILALHTACKNSLSSYQIMGLRNSRDFKSGQTVTETQDLLVDSEWEASTSPRAAEASLPSGWSAWLPLQPESLQAHSLLSIPVISSGPYLVWYLCYQGSKCIQYLDKLHNNSLDPCMQHVNPHIHPNFHECCTSPERNTNFKNSRT